MKSQWMFITGIAITFIIAIFAVLNVEAVRVNYLFGTAEWPLIFIIIGSALIGSIITGLLSMWKTTALKKRVRALEKEKGESAQSDSADQLL